VRGRLGLAVLLSLAGAGLLVWSLGRIWVEVEGVGGMTIGSLTDPVSGQDLAPGALACGYVGLAGVVALLATRGWGRVLVGVLIAAAAVGALVDVVPLTQAGTLGDRAFTALTPAAARSARSTRPSPGGPGPPPPVPS
jgi:uncharacterized membrane protein (TIGR02234 family)